MDFSDLGGLVNSLSTSGAQWYKLVASPASISVPAFAPTTAQTGSFSLAQQGLTGGTNILFIGLAILGIFLIARKG